ncbi:DNA polymerase Y family protein, partial [Burkholderia gladioli]|nr:DNA polymerase Y family protein [Burkholderia gladioli]
LSARLGADNVLRAVPSADYRPETANRWLPLHAPAGRLPAQPVASPRPAWLLAEPIPLAMRDERPCYRGQLRIMSSFERIEGGWFDGRIVLRDYHVAQDEDGACYWIYQDREGEARRWFLHGLFG